MERNSNDQQLKSGPTQPSSPSARAKHKRAKHEKVVDTVVRDEDNNNIVSDVEDRKSVADFSETDDKLEDLFPSLVLDPDYQGMWVAMNREGKLLFDSDEDELVAKCRAQGWDLRVTSIRFLEAGA
ncbi:MAG: hypothetical protein ACE5Q6_03690 [Dehalococcoidia bacterium]